MPKGWRASCWRSSSRSISRKARMASRWMTGWSCSALSHWPAHVQNAFRNSPKVRLLHGESGRHFVAAEFFNNPPHSVQGGHQREAIDAAAAALAHALLVKADDKGRSMMALHQPRGHDAHHPRMPAGVPHHDGRIPRGSKRTGKLSLRPAEHALQATANLHVGPAHRVPARRHPTATVQARGVFLKTHVRGTSSWWRCSAPPRGDVHRARIPQRANPRHPATPELTELVETLRTR